MHEHAHYNDLLKTLPLMSSLMQGRWVAKDEQSPKGGVSDEGAKVDFPLRSGDGAKGG